MNGEHDVLVSQVTGPHLGAMFDDEPDIIQQAIKSLMYQVALGVSFLHDCGVIHAGGWGVPSTYSNDSSRIKSRPTQRQHRI